MDCLREIEFLDREIALVELGLAEQVLASNGNAATTQLPSALIIDTGPDESHSLLSRAR